MTKTDFTKAVIAGSVGATFMTLFSTWATKVKNQEFREERILGSFFKEFSLNKKQRLILGWITHYTIGISFTILYSYWFKKKQIEPNFLNGAALGILNGAVGMLFWKEIIKHHPDPLKIKIKEYLFELLLAHAIFGGFSNATMRILTHKKNFKS